jgi:hypothetical protein
VAAGALLVLSSPVAFESVASANCLATLHATPRIVQAGSTVNLFGRNYGSIVTHSDIEIHLDGRTGRVIASFSPRSVLTVPVTVPADVPVGLHTLVATQYNASGNSVSCTPGRATIEVIAAPSAGAGTSLGPLAGPGSDHASGPPWLSSASPTRSTFTMAVGLALVALVLLRTRRVRLVVGAVAGARRAA